MVYLDNAASTRRFKYFVDEYCRLFNKKRSVDDKRQILDLLAKKLAFVLNTKKESISFVPNATYALNEIAYHLKTRKFNSVFIGNFEHASNHLIWLKLFPNQVFYLDLEKDFLIPKQPSIFSFSIMSNLEGKLVDIDRFSKILIGTNHVCVLDASQSIQHNIPDLNKDFVDYLVFTAHKFFGPNGLGVVYSKNCDSIGINSSNYFEDYSLDFPSLEAWSNTIDGYLRDFKSGLVCKKEKKLRDFFESFFPENEYVEWINREQKGCIFLLKITSTEIYSHDYAFYLFKKGIIVRSGLSCSLLSAEKFNASKIFRVSINYTNTIKDLESLFDAISSFSPADCF